MAIYVIEQLRFPIRIPEVCSGDTRRQIILDSADASVLCTLRRKQHD